MRGGPGTGWGALAQTRASCAPRQVTAWTPPCDTWVSPAPPPRSLALGSHSSASSHPPIAPSFFLLSLQPPRSSPLPWPTLSPPPPRCLCLPPAPHASPPPCGDRRCQGRTRLSAGRPRPEPPQEASSSGFLPSLRARGSSLPRSPPPQAGRTSRVAQGAACVPLVLNFAKVSRIPKERSHNLPGTMV